MAIYSEKWNYLFVMRGGTGCSSIAHVLINQFDGRYLPEENLFRNGVMVHGRKHNTVPELLRWGFLTKEDVRRLFIFTTVRNPFDQVASAYARTISGWTGGMPRDRHGNMIECPATRAKIEAEAQAAQAMGFDRWVEQHYGVPMRMKQKIARVVKNRRRRNPFKWVDFVMRYECLQEDFRDVLRRLGADSEIEIPNSNPTSGKRPYRQYYSESSKRLVSRAFKDVIRRYGYSF